MNKWYNTKRNIWTFIGALIPAIFSAYEFFDSDKNHLHPEVYDNKEINLNRTSLLYVKEEDSALINTIWRIKLKLENDGSSDIHSEGFLGGPINFEVHSDKNVNVEWTNNEDLEIPMVLDVVVTSSKGLKSGEINFVTNKSSSCKFSYKPNLISTNDHDLLEIITTKPVDINNDKHIKVNGGFVDGVVKKLTVEINDYNEKSFFEHLALVVIRTTSAKWASTLLIGFVLILSLFITLGSYVFGKDHNWVPENIAFTFIAGVVNVFMTILLIFIIISE